MADKIANPAPMQPKSESSSPRNPKRSSNDVVVPGVAPQHPPNMPLKTEKPVATVQQPAVSPEHPTPPGQASPHEAPPQQALPRQTPPHQALPQQAPLPQAPPQQDPSQQYYLPQQHSTLQHQPQPLHPQQHPPQHYPLQQQQQQQQQHAPQYAAQQGQGMQSHPYHPPIAPHPHQLSPAHQAVALDDQQYTDAENPFLHPRPRKPFVKRFHPLLGSIFPNLDFAHQALIHEAKRGGYAISVFTKRPNRKNPNRVIYACSKAGTHVPRPFEEEGNNSTNIDNTNASVDNENANENEEDAEKDQEGENSGGNTSSAGTGTGTGTGTERVIKRRKTTSNKTSCPFRIAIKKNYAGRWTVEKVASEFDCTVHNHEMQDQYAFPRYRNEAVLSQKDRILQMAAEGAKPSEIVAELSETEEAFCYITSKDISNFLNLHRRGVRAEDRARREAERSSGEAVSPEGSAA